MKKKNDEISPAKLLVRFYDHDDENALAEFFVIFKDLAFKIAFNVLNNSADAEDITQQTFGQILRKKALCKAAYEGNDYKVKSWLLAIIYNASRMQFNSKKKSKTFELTEGQDVKTSNLNEFDNNIENENIISKLNSALFDLPEKYRVPLLMRYHQDMSIEAISKTLSAQPGTIRSILSRGISQLRNKLSQEKVVITSIALIQFITKLTYPTPSKDMTISLLKNIEPTNQYVNNAIKLSQTNKISAFSKTLISLAICSAVASTFFIMNSKNEPAVNIKNLIIPSSIDQKAEWNFSKEKGEDLICYQSGIEYDEKENSITNITSKVGLSVSAVVGLPYRITSPIKITIISKATPNKGTYNEKLFNSLEFIPITSSTLKMGTALYKNGINKGRAQKGESWTFQFDHVFYIIDNLCVTTSKEGDILKIHTFDLNKENPYVGLVFANFQIEKINIEPLSELTKNEIKAKAFKTLNTNLKIKK